MAVFDLQSMILATGTQNQKELFGFPIFMFPRGLRHHSSDVSSTGATGAPCGDDTGCEVDVNPLRSQPEGMVFGSGKGSKIGVSDLLAFSLGVDMVISPISCWGGVAPPLRVDYPTSMTP